MEPAPKRARLENPTGMFFVPEGVSTSHVEEAVKNKIRLGEFVELNRLLRSIGDAQVANNASLSIRDGRIELNPRGRPIDTFEKFFDAFLVFMTVRGKHYPEEYPGMLKHFDTVKRLCYQRKAGIQYDRQFRTMKADYPQLPWSQFMPELVSESSQQRPSAGAQFRGNFNRPVQNMGSRRQLVCAQFNRGFCTYGHQCRFRHECKQCGSRYHTIKSCRQ